MARRGFYEDYRQSNIQQIQAEHQKPVLIKSSFGIRLFEFIRRIFIIIAYLCGIILSSAGATALINAKIREMMFDLIKNTFF